MDFSNKIAWWDGQCEFDMWVALNIFAQTYYGAQGTKHSLKHKAHVTCTRITGQYENHHTYDS